MNRIDALQSMLERRPDDGRVQFGLALEYLDAGRFEEGVRLLQRYLEESEDEGNGWGRLAGAYRERGRTEEARDAYRKGIEAARRHDHPTMVEEFEAALEDLESAG